MNTNVEKKWHRWIAIAVALLMLVTLTVPMNAQEASAATTNLQNPRSKSDGTVTWDSVWFGHYRQSSDGKYDWDGIAQTEVIPNGNTYNIYTPSELAWVARVTNDGSQNFDGKVVRLMENIDLNSHDWIPIGTETNPFKGSFDGNNYTISNLVLKSQSKQGIFGYISSEKKASLKNVRLTNIDAKLSQITSGALVGECHVAGNLKIENIKLTNYKASGVDATAGSIIGRVRNAGTFCISNVQTFSTQLTSKSNFSGWEGFGGGTIGGIVGEIVATEMSKTQFSDVLSRCKILVGAGVAGGICGVTKKDENTNSAEMSFTNCYFEGSLDAITTYGYNSAFAGGIIGNMANQNCQISQCSSVGNITSQGYHAATVSPGRPPIQQWPEGWVSMHVQSQALFTTQAADCGEDMDGQKSP